MAVISTIIVDDGQDHYYTISSCNMDRLNKIFNFIFLSYWLQQDRDGTRSKLWDWDGSGIDHYGTGNGTGSGTT